MSTPLTSAHISPEAAHNENARRELQGRLAGLGDLNGKKLSPEQKAKKLREACEGFESVFIQKMWQEMRNTLPKGGLLQGREEKFWQDMYDQELSKKMTSAGGIGLADMMYAQLSRNLVSASRNAVGTGRAAGFTPARRRFCLRRVKIRPQRRSKPPTFRRRRWSGARQPQYMEEPRRRSAFRKPSRPQQRRVPLLPGQGPQTAMRATCRAIRRKWSRHWRFCGATGADVSCAGAY